MHVSLAVPGAHNASTPPARSPPCTRAGRRPGRRGGGAGATSPAPAAASSCAASAPASRSWTTTPTIRPRSRRPSPPPATQAPGRVVVCFQPHLYSRTEALAREFGRRWRRADEVVVTEIYPAREQPVAGVTAQAGGGRGQRARGRACRWPTSRTLDAGAALPAQPRAREGDVVLTVGAGDVRRVGDLLLEQLTRRRRASSATYPISPPDHGGHGRAGRAVRRPRIGRRAARAAALARGRGRWPWRWSAWARTCWSPTRASTAWWCGCAGELTAIERDGDALALRRRGVAGGGGAGAPGVGLSGDRVRLRHPRHRRRCGADERRRLRRRDARRAGRGAGAGPAAAGERRRRTQLDDDATAARTWRPARSWPPRGWRCGRRPRRDQGHRPRDAAPAAEAQPRRCGRSAASGRTRRPELTAGRAARGVRPEGFPDRRRPHLAGARELHRERDGDARRPTCSR